VTCDDSNACTQDTCDAATGQCSHATISCDDNDPCTVDACDSAAGCSYTPMVCDDGSDCTHDTCSPGAGGCVFEPVPDGTVCDDGDPGTSGDVCNNGTCIGGS
jgi:hypothetical protein